MEEQLRKGLNVDLESFLKTRRNSVTRIIDLIE